MDDTASSVAHQPPLLEQVRQSLRVKHYSLRTEESYLYWVRYYIRFHKIGILGIWEALKSRRF